MSCRLQGLPAGPGPVMGWESVVTACSWSLLVTWLLRGLGASWTGMV
jgi:hypothetical protein